MGPRHARAVCRHWRGETHVITATEAFGEASYGATKRRTGRRGAHVVTAHGAFGGPPHETPKR
eukprot:3754888-Pyramimonas_sp.AAC.1